MDCSDIFKDREKSTPYAQPDFLLSPYITKHNIMVAVVSSKAEFDAALKHDGLVVVDFFATWCGPCKMIAPLLDKFSNEYSAAKFIKVDVDELGDVAQEYEISSMPTVLFFKNGKIVGKVIGANPAALKQALATNA